jgi:hypothetical protein
MLAIGRKLLVAVWHVLTKACADRFADPTNVARAFFGLAYDIGVRNLPNGLTALQLTRRNLDRLGIGAELTHVPWGSKTFKLPPSQLAPSVA